MVPFVAVTPKVKCTPELMRVEIPTTASTKRVYLGSLRDYPDPACRPHFDATGTLAVLELDLTDVYRCAVTRVVNKQTVHLFSINRYLHLFFTLNFYYSGRVAFFARFICIGGNWFHVSISVLFEPH